MPLKSVALAHQGNTHCPARALNHRLSIHIGLAGQLRKLFEAGSEQRLTTRDIDALFNRIRALSVELCEIHSRPKSILKIEQLFIRTPENDHSLDNHEPRCHRRGDKCCHHKLHSEACPKNQLDNAKFICHFLSHHSSLTQVL